MTEQNYEFSHRSRRGAELLMLLLAGGLGVGAYLACSIGLTGQIPKNLAQHATWLLGLILLAHLGVRKFASYADPLLLPLVAALNGLGIAMIDRIHQGLVARKATEVGPDGTSQLIWMTVGIVLFLAVLFFVIDHRQLQGFTYTCGVAAVIMLLLPLVPGIGKKIRGAQLWVGIGGFSFQPGELAKVLLVVAFAGYLVVHRDALALAGRRFLFIDLPRGRDLGPILAMWLLSLAILVNQNDFGSSLLFFGFFLIMLYVATERSGWLFVGGLLFIGGSFFGYLVAGHVRQRFEIWLSPFNNDNAYQLVQGLYGMGWGGLIGRGLGQGNPEITPLSFSDFILPAFGEELGLAGVIAILLIYGLIVERALRTALICRDGFGKLLCVGLAFVLALQTFVVIGGVTKLIPLTGLTTPFLSAGGSSLVTNWIIIGLLLRVSDHARRPLPQFQTEDLDNTQVVMLR